MGSYASTFKRVEKKYRLSAGQMRRLSVDLFPYVEVDEYGVSRIDSLYLDTPDRALIARSLEKPLYKEKLRVRAYGDISLADEVFVEVKKKYDGIVYKRRVKMPRDAARAWLCGSLAYEDAIRAFSLASGGAMADSLSWRSRQIAREIDVLLARYGTLAPSMLITCNRAAYRVRHRVDSDVRITFDSGIAYRDLFAGTGAGAADDASPASDGWRAFSVEGSFARLLKPGETLMEVKCAGAMPLWLSSALSDACAYPSSFSKYGNAYQRVRRIGSALEAVSVAKEASCA